MTAFKKFHKLIPNSTDSTALWIRLKLRKSFPIALDDESKIFIWKLICEADMIEMFELETPRPPLIPYNRNDHLDPELEIICEPVKM